MIPTTADAMASGREAIAR